MGVTQFSISLIEKALELKEVKSVIELGSQNLYSNEGHQEFTETGKYPYASKWYQKKGIEYTCIDMCGENNALKRDLSKPVKDEIQADLVTDFGTKEHVESLYGSLKNMHNLTKEGGIMIHENPKKGNWKGHGKHYFTEKFYKELAKECGYTLVETGETAAMGNEVDGWNIYAIMIKGEGDFVHHKSFNKLEKFVSKS